MNKNNSKGVTEGRVEVWLSRLVNDLANGSNVAQREWRELDGSRNGLKEGNEG